MTDQNAEFRQSLVAAVQAELERHASAVVAEVDRVREQAAADRAAMRREFDEQIRVLVSAIEQSRGDSVAQVDRSQTALEAKLADSESRQTRRLEDMTAGIDDVVQAAARPLLADVQVGHDAMGAKVDGLEAQLRKFDEQAARMVTYFNEVSEQMEQRQEQAVEAMSADVATQVAAIQQVVDDNDSSVRRFQNEVGQMVSSRLADVEDRFNNRLLATESRMQDDSGQKIADIDAHVGRVSSGLDDTMAVLNGRLAEVDDRFVESDRRIGHVEEEVKGIDQEALEELKDKLSTAAGEAMLVRIEMERLEKGVNEKADTLSVRVTEVETQLADATMDVSTAVQLERLEEIERSLIELDPERFVLRDAGSPADTNTEAESSASGGGYSNP